jgi:hypothetical protein
MISHHFVELDELIFKMYTVWEFETFKTQKNVFIIIYNISFFFKLYQEFL